MIADTNVTNTLSMNGVITDHDEVPAGLSQNTLIQVRTEWNSLHNTEQQVVTACMVDYWPC